MSTIIDKLTTLQQTTEAEALKFAKAYAALVGRAAQGVEVKRDSPARIKETLDAAGRDIDGFRKDIELEKGRLRLDKLKAEGAERSSKYGAALKALESHAEHYKEAKRELEAEERRAYLELYSAKEAARRLNEESSDAGLKLRDAPTLDDLRDKVVLEILAEEQREATPRARLNFGPQETDRSYRLNTNATAPGGEAKTVDLSPRETARSIAWNAK